MKLPEYVTKDEVRRVCKELKISDWTRMKTAKVKLADAKKILAKLPKNGMKVDPEQFRAGLEVELEHGLMFPAYNVTNNHPVLTGKIVMAHFMEMLDYYYRLEAAELEGDLLKAVAGGKTAKAKNYMKRLAKARIELAGAESKSLR